MVKTIYVENNGKSYEHGLVSFKNIDDYETNVNVECHLAITIDNQANFFEEIQNIIQKYAI